jgi:DNA-binding beta-propeller fold protein YncE
VAGTSGSYGSTSTLFHFPTTVIVDSNDNFWVVDNNNNRIQFYCRTASNTTAGRTVAGGTSGSGANQLNFPIGIALDSSLNLYVADTSNQRIQRYQRLS